jgi:hypothetical protein
LSESECLYRDSICPARFALTEKYPFPHDEAQKNRLRFPLKNKRKKDYLAFKRPFVIHEIQPEATSWHFTAFARTPTLENAQYWKDGALALINLSAVISISGL